MRQHFAVPLLRQAPHGRVHKAGERQSVSAARKASSKLGCSFIRNRRSCELQRVLRSLTSIGPFPEMADDDTASSPAEAPRHRSRSRRPSRERNPHHHEQRPKFEGIGQGRFMQPAADVTKNHKKRMSGAFWKDAVEDARKEAEAASAAAEGQEGEGGIALAAVAQKAVAKYEAAAQDAAARLEKIASAKAFHKATSGAVLQSKTATILVARRQRGEALSLREQGYLFLNEPASGRFAYWFGRLMQVLLILSSLATTYETVTWVNSATGPAVWLYTKLIFNCIFTVEALLRIMTFTPFHAVHKSLFVWLDLLTVAPLWIRFAVLPQSMTVAEYLNKMGGITIRGIEALAAFRIFKLCRYFEGASILAISVGRAMSQLLVPLFMLTLMVLGFAAILFRVQRSRMGADLPGHSAQHVVHVCHRLDRRLRRRDAEDVARADLRVRDDHLRPNLHRHAARHCRLHVWTRMGRATIAEIAAAPAAAVGREWHRPE